MEISVSPARRLSKSISCLIVLLAMVALVSCTVALEPAYNEKIVEELEALTTETEALFATIPDGIPPIGYKERSETYAALAAKAATIKLYAEARPAPTGKIVDFFSNLFSPAVPPSISDVVADAGGDRTTGAIEGDRYANATAGFMEDYLRNLKKLADKDRQNVESVIGALDNYEAAQEAYVSALDTYRQAYSDWVTGRGPKPDALQPAPVTPIGSVSAGFVERRLLVIEDILRDALFYERHILNRNR